MKLFRCKENGRSDCRPHRTGRALAATRWKEGRRLGNARPRGRGPYSAALLVCFCSFVLWGDTVDLHCGNDVCKVDVEHGARIVSWTVGGEEMLWMPSVPQKEVGKWRHGGIPLVWPWQGDEYPDGVTNGPLHGVAWQSPFKVVSRKALKAGEELALSLEDAGLRADYKILVACGSLRLKFKTTNMDKVPRKFAMSIHPYFYLSERNQTVLQGLNGLRYRDTREGFVTNGIWKGTMPITAWTDHEFFCGDWGLSSLVFVAGKVRLSVMSSDAEAFWVWNPGENWAKNGAALYGELPDDAWRHILSIEPSTFGMKDAKPLQPGESKVLTAQISRDYSI